VARIAGLGSLARSTFMLAVVGDLGYGGTCIKYLTLTSIFSLFACWFQPWLISQPTIFFSHNKPAPAGLISLETN